MISLLNSQLLQSSYESALIKAGVKPQKAERAARAMTSQELVMIGDIWPQWGNILTQK